MRNIEVMERIGNVYIMYNHETKEYNLTLRGSEETFIAETKMQAREMAETLDSDGEV